MIPWSGFQHIPSAFSSKRHPLMRNILYVDRININIEDYFLLSIRMVLSVAGCALYLIGFTALVICNHTQNLIILFEGLWYFWGTHKLAKSELPNEKKNYVVIWIRTQSMITDSKNTRVNTWAIRPPATCNKKKLYKQRLKIQYITAKIVRFAEKGIGHKSSVIWH